MSPSPERSHTNERGIALISALLITLLLTLVVVALSYRIGLFTKGTRDHVIMSQNLYTAEIGLSQARYTLMASGCIPPNLNACFPGINGTTFINLSSSIKGTFATKFGQDFIKVGNETYNLDLAGTLNHNAGDSYTYNVFVRTTNIPKVVEAMIVAERPAGEQSGHRPQTVIDAGLLYTAGDEYKQLGGGKAREGLGKERIGGTVPNTDTPNAANPRAKF